MRIPVEAMGPRQLRIEYRMKTTRTILFSLVLAASAVGCAGPPRRIQSAIDTMNRYMPEYVTESNKALADHPDAERLMGIGTRLRIAMDSLDKWAKGGGE